MKRYSEEKKSAVLKRMLAPECCSPEKLSQEYGISTRRYDLAKRNRTNVNFKNQDSYWSHMQLPVLARAGEFLSLVRARERNQREPRPDAPV